LSSGVILFLAFSALPVLKQNAGFCGKCGFAVKPENADCRSWKTCDVFKAVNIVAVRDDKEGICQKERLFCWLRVLKKWRQLRLLIICAGQE
jgi:hypothetical protein